MADIQRQPSLRERLAADLRDSATGDVDGERLLENAQALERGELVVVPAWRVARVARLARSTASGHVRIGPNDTLVPVVLVDDGPLARWVPSGVWT